MNNKVTRNIEKHLLEALRDKENEIDLEIKRYEKLEKKIYDENDEELEFIKNKRLQELKNKHNENLNLLKKGHGIYKEILSEKEFFEICKSSKNVCCHFYRTTTWRCEYLDSKLISMSKKFLHINFVKINAEKSPFLCERLKIWCIPTLMLIQNGQTEHSIIGFDELGGDNFSEQTLINVLKKWKLIDSREAED
ncbi:phosducin-like protein, putative [Plasmodium vivax]|uniref:Thioredoxin domain containing protein n=6 Tax=Plasmodium vivax TaxID=5855 RepID=A5K787_PLAVS|nr:thioredoxin domain containing protein [Plasmodium vivax]KMZ81033.1 thioredoxin domain-containing protein [Plasmodium vivax India VII]KMZ86925.1 thioredoxin domain-containing protein [Plasmodium vivax Brazil I]KMZ93358.1 thioredoxin domain-containing protein [Plasmodium vivax Mauritania I]KNA00207.1 thioredoxin domain-containing protein [Plasmodium vivax North Korean]EDL44646.1 thioredoxin domain containing protein [Plasmodium vivax]|eukprot:XP_001614373.1 thioredoxin domain containing protein [Plasmodium vivax Sal-1]